MDRTTTMLLAAIALGLWVNAGVAVYNNRVLARAVYDPDIAVAIGALQEQVTDLINGTCRNDKLC